MMMMMMILAFVREEEGGCFWNNLGFWVLHDLFWKRIWPQKETTSLLFRSDLWLVLLRLPSIFVWPPEDGDYAQTLSFRGDGKIVQQPQLSDSAWRVSDGMYLQDVPIFLNLVLSGFTPPRIMNECPFSWKNFSSNPSINFQGTFVHFRGLSIHIWCNWTPRWSCLEAVWVLLQLPTMDWWAKYRAKWQKTWKSDWRWRLQTKACLELRVWCDGHENSHAAMTVCCEWANSFASFWTMWWG